MRPALHALLLGGALAAAAAAAADAATLIGLTSDNQLVRIDTEARRASAPVRVSGAPGRLLGIDVRPADGKLYGLTDSGRFCCGFSERSRQGRSRAWRDGIRRAR